MPKFKRQLTSSRAITRTLRERAREQQLGPDDLDVYVSKTPHSAKTAKGELVSTAHNALAMSDGKRFTCWKVGRPFVFYGKNTKAYPTPVLLKLLGITHPTLNLWISKGIVPPPAVGVNRLKSTHNVWLYYQVQPVYTWVQHVRARGIKLIQPEHLPKEMKYLKTLVARAERKWMLSLGKEYADPYMRAAGKYGVLWLAD